MSLNLRISLSAAAVLIIFITLTAAALNRAYINSAESALRDQLTSQLYALLAAADVSDDGVMMPSNELDALLGLPSSGVYAYITDATGKNIWQSSSALGAVLPTADVLKSGTKRFQQVTVQQQSFYTFAYGINWVTDSHNIPLTFNIATDLVSFEKQLKKFRTTLWGWLVAMAILLLVSQAIILRWGLLPLRRVKSELNNIETGKQQNIQQIYPREIEQLTRNINLLLQQERDQKSRYRNALGDLAHSLKTPLAVLQSGLDSSEKDSQNMLEQVKRMNSIVEYQLQHAATSGISNSASELNIRQLITRILDSLHKVYYHKTLQLNIHIDKELTFKGDEGDLMELFGNLLDNAFKWSKHSIDISAEHKSNKLCIHIIDDGPGIPTAQIETLLQRGKRADENVAGHGIGLSIVANIVDAYQGEMHITQSPAGGIDILIIL